MLGGTVGAVLLQTPSRVFLRALHALRYVLLPPGFPLEERIKRTISWAQLARPEGLLGLERMLGKEEDNIERLVAAVTKVREVFV